MHKAKFVTKCKLVCPMHNKTKQIQTLEFGAEKDFLQSRERGRVAHALRNPKHSKGFQKNIFKGKVSWGGRGASRVSD